MKHLLYMLWTGDGLWGWLLPWLPVLFKCVIGWFVLRLVYRIYWAPPSPRGVPVRGSRLVAFGWVGLRKLLSPDRLRIGGVALPRELESLHLLINGATGAGKSQTIHGTLSTLRARGDAAIITDIGSEALRGFGRADDWIMNPLDARSVAWSPFAEMDGPADAERLAKSMIPDHEGIEREWFVYSQALVAAALKRLWERGGATNESLLHALTLASPAELKALVQGLPAQALFHEGAEKMLASVRGIIGSYFAPYSYLAPEAGPKSWSIRRYVRDGQGWLWLSYREDQAAALRPLLAAWIGEAVNAKLSLRAERVRRHWLLLDEVASLGRVQGLSDALTKGRKYGLCAIIGLQSVAQLRDAYGTDGAQTLLSCLSQQHQVERLVLASQIQGLPNRVGYLRLAGQDSVRCVYIPLIQRTARMEAFVPRKLSTEALPLPTAPASSPVSSACRPLLDADAILGHAQATGNEK
jgi:hypothetical protein